jgi:hypothetical protein
MGKIETYTVNLLGGGHYAQQRKDMHNAIDGEIDGMEQGDEIILTITRMDMTQEEYDSLPEFTGH